MEIKDIPRRYALRYSRGNEYEAFFDCVVKNKYMSAGTGGGRWGQEQDGVKMIEIPKTKREGTPMLPQWSALPLLTQGISQSSQHFANLWTGRVSPFAERP